MKTVVQVPLKLKDLQFGFAADVRLNEWGWKKPTFEELAWKVYKLPTKDVTFGSSQPEIRKTRYISGVTIDFIAHKLPEVPGRVTGNEGEDECHEIYPTRFQKLMIDDIEMVLNQSWDLYITEEGGFTKPQTFAKENEYHFATALLFPPALYSTFEGGDLILRSPTGIVKIEPSKFKDWTYVAFHLSVEYECTPVTKGRRLFFKDNLELPDEPYFFNNTMVTATPVSLQTEQIDSYRKSEIERLEKKIQKLQEMILDLRESRTSLRVRGLLNQIREADDNCLIVLGKMVSSPAPATPESLKEMSALPIEFEGEEAFLWNAIVAEWPYSTLRRCKAFRSFDGSDDITILDGNGNELSDETGNIIYFQKISEVEDDFVHLVISVICVQKEQVIMEEL
jgi:hypothetical protein